MSIDQERLAVAQHNVEAAHIILTQGINVGLSHASVETAHGYVIAANCALQALVNELRRKNPISEHANFTNLNVP